MRLIPNAIAQSLFVVAFLTGPAIAQQDAPAPQPDSRAHKLLAAMTLDEKVGQLSQTWGGVRQDTNPTVSESVKSRLHEMIEKGEVGSLLGAHGAEYTNGLQRIAVEKSRLKIPLILGNDVIHGYRTIFPIPLAEAASWNPKLVEKAARVAAVESAAAGTHWTFAPMVDVCRDPRWGRIAEGSGEDPYLGAAMAAARVRGFQGTDLTAPDTVLACAKHFAAYGAPEAGRDYNTVDISISTLHNVHLPAFKAAVDAGVGSLMSAFNELNGVPATANPYLLTDVLRTQWGFSGFVVSDWDSIEETSTHGFAATDADAAAGALSAGVDMDMASFNFRDGLPKALKQGDVTMADIDNAVLRVLQAKETLGLFERPYIDPATEARVTLCDDHRKVAREIAQQSVVLLKNDGNLLPLTGKVKTLAVIGTLAESKRDPLGTWAAVGRPEDAVTILEGLREHVGDSATVEFERGCNVNDDDRSGIEAAVALAKRSDVAILVVGESQDLSGEAHCRTSLGLPGVQLDLVRAVHATGTPTVVVLMSGRPMSIAWTAENVPAILATWHLGVESGHAIADVLFGKVSPSGKLPVCFPRNVGQVPIYYAHKSTGRPPGSKYYSSKYLDSPTTPLYPFGYGLSYTTYTYSPVTLRAQSIAPDGTLEATAKITNTGSCPGVETVQLYIRDHIGSLTRPVKELRGFQQIALEPGESKNVVFALPAQDLGFYNNQGRYVVEPGQFSVWIAPHAAAGEPVSFTLADK